MLVATKPGRVVTCDEELPSIKPRGLARSRDKLNIRYISTTTEPVAIKLSKMVNYYKGVPCIKLCNPLGAPVHVFRLRYIFYRGACIH